MRVNAIDETRAIEGRHEVRLGGQGISESQMYREETTGIATNIATSQGTSDG